MHYCQLFRRNGVKAYPGLTERLKPIRRKGPLPASACDHIKVINK